MLDRINLRTTMEVLTAIQITEEKMQLSTITAVVAGWAASEPLIRRAWVFGSRVRGTCRRNSDVDVAIEVSASRGDSGAFVTFVFAKDKLKGSIEALLELEVDLQWYGGPIETPTIHAGLQQSSVLVYEAG